MKGLNFALPPKKLKYEDFILPFELLYRNVMSDENTTAENLMHVRTQISNIALSTYRGYNRKKHQFENLSKEEYESFLNLAYNKNIIIQKSDKGNSVVIIDSATYTRKMENILSDTSKFVQFSEAYKVNKELRHVFDMEKDIEGNVREIVNSGHMSK